MYSKKAMILIVKIIDIKKDIKIIKPRAHIFTKFSNCLRHQLHWGAITILLRKYKVYKPILTISNTFSHTNT